MDTEANTTQLHLSKQKIVAEPLTAGEKKCIVAANDDSTEKRFCTRAVTGCSPVFQEIYICRTCGNDNQQRINDDVLPLCVCSACADNCHSDHDIEYVGMGPCFCDCDDFNCNIFLGSIDEANRLGFTATNHVDQLHSPLISINYRYPNYKDTRHSYVRDVYHIPSLQKKTFRDVLVIQSNELIRHSKDTFWLDADIVEKSMRMQCESLCELEYFAWSIFCQHVRHYFSIEALDLCDKRRVMGAEWWVQVKTILPAGATTFPTTDSISAGSQSTSTSSPNFMRSVEAIDLHYDKDEQMASSFGIGIFPSISTITYLTDAANSSPTIIFPRRYDEDDGANEGKISDMFISYPNVTKHVAFDGRLLHGAPSHPFLRRQNVCCVDDQKISDNAFPLSNESRESITRITFLVNVWIDHKPVGVSKLPVPISAAIQTSMIGKDNYSFGRDDGIIFIPSVPVREINLMHENDLPEFMRQQIELPFVGGKASWGDKDDEDGAQEKAEDEVMVITTYPPPPNLDCDTLLVQFGSGLEAKFKYDEVVYED